MSWLSGLRSVYCRGNYSAVPNKGWNSILVCRYSEKSDPVEKPDDDRVVERKHLSGYVYDEGIEGYKSKWRTPYIEKKGFFKSKLGAFASKRFSAQMTNLHPDNFKHFDFKKWWNKEKREKLVYDQQFLEERLIVLGCDLAAAHFTVYRGGGVRFVGQNQWIRDNKKKAEYDEDLPNSYDPNYAVEALDLSKTSIVYEGLQNIQNLPSLKWLSFANCPYFDNWCLDRISGEHRNNLEYLDISFTNVTHNGLYALYRFNKLKTLKVDEYKDDPLYFEMCLELQNEFKGLNVELVTTEITNEKRPQIETSSVSHVQN